MKKITFFGFTLIVLIFGFQSCQNNDPIVAETPKTQESIALRTTLNEIKEANDIVTGRVASTTRAASSDDFCFDFVYPIQLTYNNESTVSVASFEGLILLLINETSSLHIVGIAMPFDVVLYENDNVISINSEQDFVVLLENCELEFLDDEAIDTDCFDFTFPLEIISGDQTRTITSLDNLLELLEEENDYYEPNFVFPISVILASGDELLIESLYDFTELLDECEDCDCPDIEEPVCVLDPVTNDIIKFDNECEALCEGYIPNNFIDCDSDECNIYDLEVSVGDCNTDGTYNLTINFEYENSSNEYFDIVLRDFDFFDYFELSDLPITITNFPLSGYEVDSLYVNINDNLMCREATGWESPDCEDTYAFVDYVGECFDFIYPFEAILDGITYTINSYVQFTYYFNETTEGAALVYPLEIINLTTSDVEEIEDLEDLMDYIDEYCE